MVVDALRLDAGAILTDLAVATVRVEVTLIFVVGAGGASPLGSARRRADPEVALDDLLKRWVCGASRQRAFRARRTGAVVLTREQRITTAGALALAAGAHMRKSSLTAASRIGLEPCVA
jgi:hypothetical protein